MKNIKIFLLLINLFITLQNSISNSSLNDNKTKPKRICWTDKIKSKKSLKFYSPEEEPKYGKEKRNLQSEDFQPIRIYQSLTTLNAQIDLFGRSNNEYKELLKEIIQHLNNTIEYITKLIKVSPRYNLISLNENQQKDLDVLVSTTDQNLVQGVSSDLVIIPSYDTAYDFSSTIVRRDESTNRPIIAIIYFRTDFMQTNEQNKKFYIEYLLLHQFTHILGFSSESFKYFPGGENSVIRTYYKRGINRKYIVTPTVLRKAREYFKCDSLEGIELEDQEDGEDITGSHWDARILLGDYMNSEQYSPEVVISDFTLALLEDSGWYKVNYYTGGLFRFGKQKGCQFINNECLDSGGSTSFKNEFFDRADSGNPSCSSGRLSRTYCETKQYTSISPGTYNRFNDNSGGSGIGGRIKNADYCFVFANKEDEENEGKDIYVGSCKYGNGNYGSQITYNSFSNNGNKDLTELKEVYSENSFCILSEAYPASSPIKNKYSGVIHPMCYEMFCTDKVLEVKINNQYIVCPIQGGRVEVSGDLQGYIYCPDYNLICTGSVMCNDMFDCINKNSVSKELNYGYTVNGDTSSQKISLIKTSSLVMGYELDDNGKCPIYCAQCKETKRCFKCKDGFNLIGVQENDNRPIVCDNTTNLSTGYFKKDNVYYPCLAFCIECESSTTCKTCDIFHTLNAARTQCDDKIPNCDEYNPTDLSCLKCKTGYAFIKQDRMNCYNNITEDKYFTIDGGISYYPCDTNVSNCDICNNKPNSCDKCKTNYYFLGTNRTFCFINTNLTNYYTYDNGISYVLCNTTISNCDTCTYANNALTCNVCQKDYYFIKDNRKECFTGYDLSKYYSEDNGKSYYPCNTEFENCEVCNNNKRNCSKCLDGYFFIGAKREKCETIQDLDKYFTEDNGVSYWPCNTDMTGCEKCISRHSCTLCESNYYFVSYDRSKCHYNIDLDRFYKEGDAYFPCNSSISNCDRCSNKFSCIQCYPNYYFIENDRTTCRTGLNLNKYYTTDNGISYFLCLNKMHFCDECSNANFCNLCLPSYALKYEISNECFSDSELSNDRSYYRLNSTHYRKCSDSIRNCLYCSSSDICDQCIANYYFINNNRSVCVNIRNINVEEYYKYDEYNYHLCSWLIDNCKKCNETSCNFCHDTYTLVNDNYQRCYVEADYQIGYYKNDIGNMYYPCLDNCEICRERDKCIECRSGYSLYGEGSSCGSCTAQDLIVNDELTKENIEKLIKTYIRNYKEIYDMAVIYSNPNLNYTLVVYRTWQCTELLFSEKYYQINTREFSEKLRNKFKNNGSPYVYAILNYNYKSYFEVYDINLDRPLNMSVDCPECIRIEYEIKNNYISQINHLLGSKLTSVVYKYKINVLNASDPFFHDSCYNLEINTIDVDIDKRRELFYMGDELKTITCMDDDCIINSVSYDEYIGTCSCKMNFDFERLTSNNNTGSKDSDYNYEESNAFNPVSGVNPLPIFTCSLQTFDSQKISSNAGLYIGGVIILIQIVAFIVFLVYFCKRKKIVQNIASPPPKDTLTLKKKVIYKDDNEKKAQAKDKEYDEYYDAADKEKKVQKRDEDEEEEEEEETEKNDFSNIFKNTQVLSEESIDMDRKNMFASQRKLNEFDFEKINPDEFQNISGIKKKSIDEENTTENKSLDISEDEIFTLVQTVKGKLELDYLIIQEAKEKDKRTISELYVHLLALKQPIWDMLSEIKALDINKSFIPLSNKIIRFLFILAFNIFMNSLFLTQNYFKKKYEYFNNKYNIQNDENIEAISSNVKFAYAIKHTIGYAVANFVIIFIIQFAINYYFFNIRKKIWIIIKDCDDMKEEIKQLNIFFHEKNRSFILIFFINFILMLFFVFYIINFSEAFKGGILDYVAGALMTWIFLQVFPFITCFISVLFRYYGLKNNNSKLYKMNQVYIF